MLRFSSQSISSLLSLFEEYLLFVDVGRFANLLSMEVILDAKLLDEYYQNEGTIFGVNLLDVYGSDAKIVSYAKVCRGEDAKQEYSIDEQKKLLNFLAARKHLTPFEFGGLVIQVRCPIFVARQMERYRTATILERSLRSQKPLVYEKYNEKSEVLISSRKRYKELVDKGYSREIARRVLTLSENTQFVWKNDLRNIFHFLEERLSPEAEIEIRWIAKVIEYLVREKFPLSYGAWKANK